MTPPGGMHLEDARAPESMRIYAIGDVHGCASLLEALYARIDADLERQPPADWRIIHLGDYCDRGPETKRVLELILERSQDRRVLSLMGNHEEAWLGFLAEPAMINLFVSNGGDKTIESYGIIADFSDLRGRKRTRDTLLSAMPTEHLDFLKTLPRSFSFGDYYFCHAGIRPGVPLEIQDREDLVWIRKDFLTYFGLHPKVIIHGHTPQDAPDVRPNRINVDTGAYKTGILTAVVLEGNNKRFLEVGRERRGSA